eukprot:1829577-Rhodomonas_salina.3
MPMWGLEVWPPQWRGDSKRQYTESRGEFEFAKMRQNAQEVLTHCISAVDEDTTNLIALLPCNFQRCKAKVQSDLSYLVRKWVLCGLKAHDVRESQEKSLLPRVLFKLKSLKCMGGPCI